MIIIALLAAAAAQVYKYPAFDSLLRLPSFSPVDIVYIENSLIILGDSGGKAVIKREVKGNTLWTKTLTRYNNSTSVAVSESNPMLVAINVDWNVQEPLPTKKPDTPRTGQSHGLIYEISATDGTIISAMWAGDCLANGSPIKAFKANSRAYYIAGLCGGAYYLQSPNWIQPLDGTPTAMAITQSNIYITQTNKSITQVSQFNSAGTQTWKVSVNLAPGTPSALAVYTDVLFTSQYLAVCSYNTIAVLNQNGELLWSATVPGDFECIEVQLMPGLGFVVAGNVKGPLYSSSNASPVLGVIWFSFTGSKLAFRAYDAGALAKLIGIVYTDQLSVAVVSASAFYQEVSPPQQPSALVFEAQNPFDLAQCASACSSCFDLARSTCFSCKTFEESRFTCGECPAECTACKSTTECTGCVPSYILRAGKCNLDLNCPEGKYTDSALKACVPCHATCASCTGPAASDCVTCASLYSLNDGFCLAKCPSYRYSEGGICKDCNAGCQRCEGTPNYCTSCPDKLYLSQGKCLPACPDATYLDNGKCTQCHASCAACTGPLPTNCVTCKAGLISFQLMCLEKCPDGYYLASSTCKATPICPPMTFFDSVQCSPCHPNCSECFGASSTDCKSCLGDFFYKGSSCVEHRVNCTEGHYLTANNTCYNCTETCSTCTSLTDCQSCKDGTFMLDSSCLKECPTSTYQDSNQCLYCPDGCLTCTGNSTCLQCYDGWFFDSDLCLQTCPLGKYDSGGNCTSCSMGCLTCNNATICSQCDEHYYLNNDTCEKCSYPCSICSDSDNCEACAEGFYELNQTCIEECPKFFGPKDGHCEACPTRCEVCSEGNCSKCAMNAASMGRYAAEGGTCSQNVSCSEGWRLEDDQCTTEMSGLQEFLYFMASQLMSS